MYYFLIPLIAGFLLNLASTFTTAFSEKWGKKQGTFLTILLRDIFGIPVWAFGFVLAIKESQKLLFQPSAVVQIAGWLLMLCGGIIVVVALVSIRIKAAAPSVNDSLVEKGIYSLVRHPIHCGTFLEFVSLFLLWPSFNMVISLFLGILWIIFQSKLEERDLIRRIPGYTEYMKKVPAFFPGFGGIASK